MQRIEMVLHQQKQTKNKTVYGADNVPIPSVYIITDDLPKSPPQSIKVTIEAVEG